MTPADIQRYADEPDPWPKVAGGRSHGPVHTGSRPSGVHKSRARPRVKSRNFFWLSMACFINRLVI